ncbi:MAG: Ig-like domain-containing protein [Anaerostipes sp.]|nr:Ig-like domain-containing protein [Anaerostipes sp.]
MRQKKRISIILGLFFILCMATPVMAKKPYIKVTSSTTVKIPTGKTSKIYAKSKGKKVKLTYKTSKKSVATVTSKGTIKGKKYGSATITIKGKGLKSKKIKVYIKKPVTAVALSSEPWITLSKLGAKSQIKAYVKPGSKYVVSSKLTYRSCNTKVATVSSTGLITAKAKGDTIIKVSSSSKSGTVKSTSIYVTVAPATTYPALVGVGFKTQTTKELDFTLDTVALNNSVRIIFVDNRGAVYSYDMEDIKASFNSLKTAPKGSKTKGGIRVEKVADTHFYITLISTGEKFNAYVYYDTYGMKVTGSSVTGIHFAK